MNQHEDFVDITIVKPNGDCFGMTVPPEQLRRPLGLREVVNNAASLMDRTWTVAYYDGFELRTAKGAIYWVFINTEARRETP